VISTLVDWNYPPAFPAGIPTSAPGHLATPSSEERIGNMEESTVQALDTLINSLESDKESSSHTVVNEEVITQAEKESGKPLVENPKTLVDHSTLSTPEPIVVEDSEPLSTSQTLVVDPSSSRILSNDVVKNTWIAEHGVGVRAEALQGHETEVKIASEDIVQWVDKNESAPAQQKSEDTFEDEIESSGVDTSMPETKIIGRSFTSLELFPHIYFTQV
jgi:hypothetical protein